MPDSVALALAQLARMQRLRALTAPQKAQSIDSAAAEAWERGDLSYKLLPHQVGLYHDIKRQLWGEGDGGSYTNPRGRQRKYLQEFHRKFGKSTNCGIIAVELARAFELAGRRAQIYWAAETSKQVARFLLPIMDSYVLNDCPEHLRPTWLAGAGMYVFPRGSNLFIGGCDDRQKIDRLRGPHADLFIVDEAGQIADLGYLYRSVVLWMTAQSGGRVLIPSTPAPTPGHAFTEFCILAESGDGGYARRTVHDSAWPDELLDELARECGGRDTADWRREALCERVIDLERAIVPEFSAGKPECEHCLVHIGQHHRRQCEGTGTVYKSTSAEYAITLPFCLRCDYHSDRHESGRCPSGAGVFEWEVERPTHFDAYLSIDPGDSPSLTAISGGYWNFAAALVVIEDEATLKSPTTEDILGSVRRIELGYPAGMHRRFSDVDKRLIADMTRLHGLEVWATPKDNAQAQLNEVRLLVGSRGIRIHPRCRQLRAHLRAGIKSKNGKDWEIIDGFGHFDHIAALIYLVRNIDRQRNPFPDDVTPNVQNTTGWRRAQQDAEVPAEYRELARAWPGGRQ